MTRSKLSEWLAVIVLAMLWILVPVMAAAAQCAGDCDENGSVSIDEVLQAVNVALGGGALEDCAASDADRDGTVTITDLLAAVNSVLEGCRHQQTAFVVATDFETGSFGTISLDTPRTVAPANPGWRVHSDAVARTFDGLLYVVNRFFGDNIQVLDPSARFATRLQCLTGERSNPHDIAVVNPRKAYVTAYERTTLLIVDPGVPPNCAGFIRGTIDLSSFADADGIPEMDQLAVVSGRLFVSLQRLGRRDFFRPAGRGSLVVIDMQTDTVIDEIVLSGTNPFSQSKGLPVVDGAIAMAQVGEFGVMDGGIERVDIERNLAEGFFVTEAALGGDITDFVLVSDQLGYAVVSDATFRNAVIAFDPRAGTMLRTVYSAGGYLSDLELSDRGELFVADRTARRPGIRIFRAVDGVQLTAAPLDLGLPPFDIVFLDAPR